MNRTPDAEVVLRLIPTTSGGKERAVLSGYRPNYAVRDDYLTSVNHEFIGVEKVEPGGEGLARVWFITPEEYPNALWLGREIQVTEGSRVVGSAVVVTIYNPILLRMSIFGRF